MKFEEYVMYVGGKHICFYVYICCSVSHPALSVYVKLNLNQNI